MGWQLWESLVDAFTNEIPLCATRAITYCSMKRFLRAIEDDYLRLE